MLLCIFAISTIWKFYFMHLYDETGKEFYLIMQRQFGSQLVFFYSGTAILLYFDKFQKYVKYLLPSAITVYVLLHFYNQLEPLYPFCLAIMIIGIAYN